MPIKAAKGSLAERSQASSFIECEASKLQKRELRLSLHSSGVRRNFCLSPVDKLISADVVSLPYPF